MNKKDITIHKKKTDYKDGYVSTSAKEILFDYLTLQQILEELQNNNVWVTLQDIKETYEKTHHLQSTLDILTKKYEKELDAIDDKMELFDADAFYFLCDKYVMENYYPTQLFDPDYMEDLIDEFDEASKKNKIPMLHNILQNINGISQYKTSKNLFDVFEGTFFDAESYMQDATLEVLNLNVSKEDSLQFAEEFKTFLNTYNLETDTHYNISSDLIEILARYGLKEVQTLLDSVINDFPSEKQSTYLSLLYGLEHCGETDNMKTYYKKAMQLKPVSRPDKNNRKILIENFSYLDN